MSTLNPLPQSMPVKDVRKPSNVGCERLPSRHSLPTRDWGLIVSDVIMIAPLSGTGQGKSCFQRFIDAIRYIFTGPLFEGLVEEDGIWSRQPGLGGRIYECIFEGCPEEEETGLLSEASRAARLAAFQANSDSEEE